MGVALHVGKRIPPIDWQGVPVQYRGRVSAVCRTADECGELVRWFGDAAFCPYLPVMLLVPGADAPTLIAGLGYATAAELQDCAVVTWERQTGRLKKDGRLLDYDTLREKHGLMRREDVDASIRQALRDRVAQHKANPVSDPPRVPLRANPGNRMLFPVEEVLDA